MSCSVPRLVVGARHLKVVVRFVERDDEGRTVPTDLAGAETSPGFASLLFRKPDRSTVTVPAVVDLPTSLGEVHYFTAPGFLDQAGEWEVQGWVSVPGSGDSSGFFASVIGRFVVEPMLRAFTPVEPLAPAAAALELEPPAPLVA